MKEGAIGEELFRVYPSRWYMLFCCSMFTALQGGYVVHACSVPLPRIARLCCKNAF